MKIYTENELENYKRVNLEYDETWEKRDFVNYVTNYFHSGNNKVLAISGLRGTGKTVGILQAAAGLDCIYITAQKNESEKGNDYIELLKNTEKKYVIIDEYSWINEREELDKYLATAVENGKRVVITGTESITLDFLNYGNLIHRVDVKHVTLFTYEEYCRLYHKTATKDTCDEYLQYGGLFKAYQIKNFDSMQEYIKTALIDNLTGYMNHTLSENRAKQIIYTIFYKAICSSTETKFKQLYEKHTPITNYFDVFKIDPDIDYPEAEFNRDINRVSDILEEVGVIVKINNVVDKDNELCKELPVNWDKTPSFKTYVVNPSLTCQLIKAIYDIDKIPPYLLGSVLEASAISYLSSFKLADDKLYFYEYDNKNGTSSELDALIVQGNADEHLYLFECKREANPKLKESHTIRSNSLNEFLRLRFPNAEIDGRFVIYNGTPAVKYYDGEPYAFVGLDKKLSEYSYFSDLLAEHQTTTELKGNSGKVAFDLIGNNPLSFGTVVDGDDDPDPTPNIDKSDT